jgi:hypothetical protein
MFKDFLKENKVYHLRLPNGDKRKIGLEELKKMSVNPKHVIPELSGNKTWVSNYVGTFWMPFMKPQAFALYFQLVKLAFGEKNYAFPSVPYLSMLTGMSVRSVHKYLMELYDLGFLTIIESQDAYSGKQDSNIYLMSELTPFISTEHYKQLPKRLQEEHDEYLERIKSKKVLIETPEYER